MILCRNSSVLKYCYPSVLGQEPGTIKMQVYQWRGHFFLPPLPNITIVCTGSLCLSTLRMRGRDEGEIMILFRRDKKGNGLIMRRFCCISLCPLPLLFTLTFSSVITSRFSRKLIAPIAGGAN